MPKFQIAFSAELDPIVDRLNYLNGLNEVNDIKFDQDGRFWYDPVRNSKSRLSFDQYDELLDQNSRNYSDREVGDL